MGIKLGTWGEGDDPTQCGVVVGEFQVSLAELLDVDSRAFGLDCSLPAEILDSFEETGKEWDEFGEWLWEQVRKPHHREGSGEQAQ